MEFDARIKEVTSLASKSQVDGEKINKTFKLSIEVILMVEGLWCCLIFQRKEGSSQMF